MTIGEQIAAYFSENKCYLAAAEQRYLANLIDRNTIPDPLAKFRGSCTCGMDDMPGPHHHSACPLDRQ